MLEKYIPDAYQKSICTINYNKLKDNGIKCLLFDLDNTSVPFKEKEPTKKLIQLFEELKDMNFKIIILSNATKKRLLPFKKKLLVDCMANSRKPRKQSFLKVINMFNYDLSEVAIIGDQLFTDIYGGNRVGIMTILVNPMSHSEYFFTKIARIFEKIKYKKMAKYGYLIKGSYYD